MKAAKPLLIVLVSLFAFGTPSYAQEVNLIPNNSFEEYSGVPLGWFYNGNQYSKLVKYWYSPTLASPDAFGPEIIVPKHWRKKGFGNQKSLDGSSFSGITVYGCSEGKPHCREYLQIQLNESLVIGQKYNVSYLLSHLENSLYIDKIGAYFTTEALKQDNDELLTGKPQVYSRQIIKPLGGNWQKVTGSFIAKEAHNYLTIGNFSEDEDNKVDRRDSKFEFAYYYIDKIVVSKVPPFVHQELPADDLSKQSLSVGKKIQLRNIYFDLDKWDLLPRSFVELNKLKKILADNDRMQIEVHGHTDIQGESDYNIDLSMQRAQSVKKYLIEQGIDSARIDFKGFGSNAPIADNSDESGRKLNRRVEILITSL